MTLVEPDAIYDVECDVFAPCALGGVLNEQSIPKLRCAIVCGAANNQMATDQDDNRLDARGILYAPDFIANAGGVINVYYEYAGGYQQAAAMEKAGNIYDTTKQVIATSRERGVTTAEAADAVAEARLKQGPRP